MTPIGYFRLIQMLGLEVTELTSPAYASASVNSRTDGNSRVLFPIRVLSDDTPVWHLEFALRHEDINLEVIDAAFAHIDPAALVARFHEAPTGAYIRKACFLWEWLTGQHLATEGVRNGGYVDLLDAKKYFTRANGKRMPRFRVRNNALGSARFCPTVHRTTACIQPSLQALLKEAQTTLDSVSDPALYERALSYLYLSETRGSFAIENETPSGNKQERFVQLLRHAGEPAKVTEDWLVDLQNAIVQSDFAKEASYRTKQNWMEDRSGRVTLIPAPVDALRDVMAGWEAFANDEESCEDWLVKAACVAFGFVYLHPFLDGNGRIHRFLIQHIIARSGLAPGNVFVPVSAVIGKHLSRYHQGVVGFSGPVSQLWDYQRGADEPVITRVASSRPYRFFHADEEVAFLHAMIEQAVRVEIPEEIAFLSGYDRAFNALNTELDLPQSTLAALIRNIHGNHGQLSNNIRKKHFQYPDALFTRILEVVRQEFGLQPLVDGADDQSHPP
jgi:hypothetical protein